MKPSNYLRRWLAREIRVKFSVTFSKDIMGSVAINMQNILGIHNSMGKINYLIFTLSLNKGCHDDTSIVISKVEHKLTHWKGKFLSYARRKVLVRAVTSAIPIYWIGHHMWNTFSRVIPRASNYPSFSRWFWIVASNHTRRIWGLISWYIWKMWNLRIYQNVPINPSYVLSKTKHPFYNEMYLTLYPQQVLQKNTGPPQLKDTSSLILIGIPSIVSLILVHSTYPSL